MKVFLSHSKKDRKLANKIAKDLKGNNIDVWFDEWEIFVGDSIIQKVQHGLNTCNYLSVLFTKNSLESSWVEKEWQAVLNKEINKRNIILLPIKGDNCELPFILTDKLYADISTDYEYGLKKLTSSINHHNSSKEKISKQDQKENNVNEIELKLSNIDFDNFTTNDKEKVAKAISELIGGNFDIKIIGVRRGSVILKFKLPNEITTKDFFRKLKKFEENIGADDAWLVDESEINLEDNQSKLLQIEGTSKTPFVQFDLTTGKGTIKGRSIPENSINFYRPIIDWIEENLTKFSLNSFELDINLEYFNTSSSKCILDIFKQFESIHKTGIKTNVNWHYEEDDEDMLEAGEDYESIIQLPFRMIQF